MVNIQILCQLDTCSQSEQIFTQRIKTKKVIIDAQFLVFYLKH